MIQNEKIETEYNLCEEGFDETLQATRTNFPAEIELPAPFKDQDDSDLSTECTKNSHDEDLKSSATDKKGRRRKCTKLFCRHSKTIDEDFPNKLTTEEVEEYNKNPEFQTEPTLKPNPYYAKHVMNDETKLRQLLARRSCHLPGNSWWQDWLQYISNNHPLFGLFLHHSSHPVTYKNRIFILMASISYGILATNLVYLWFLTSEEDFEQTVMQINIEYQEGFYTDAVITSGAATLMIFNGGLHVAFDNAMWHISAATFCQNLENYEIIKKIGSRAVIAIAVTLLTVSSFILMMRANQEMNDADKDIIKIEAFFALLGYILELSLVYLVINPIFATIKFSGILGCFPGSLGGRPRDLQREINSLYEERVAYRESLHYGNDADYEIV
mmetsp:Transcript_26777/g.31153  ORF Transcript_26777/g.31153 Transcript_26777/m.31153 type:complete len:385 (-) Transcript_26777:79-1233(-)